MIATDYAAIECPRCHAPKIGEMRPGTQPVRLWCYRCKRRVEVGRALTGTVRYIRVDKPLYLKHNPTSKLTA